MHSRDTSEFTSGQQPDIQTAESFAAVMTETRHFFLSRNSLMVISKSSNECVLSVTLSVKSQKSDQLVGMNEWMSTAYKNQYLFL